ncbi:MAG: amidophosphoribosyltransferase [Parcubacteria group bacterium Gr01-1014_8]|nr:MAG: amidophosphoribosyltransferase [Parcubacteria group bacterium Gr01-1014_8]
MEEIKEKCAVFGVHGKGLEAARLAYFGLYSLQHRGQESSGISTADGTRLYCHKDMGLVAQVFSEDSIKKLHGHIAIGHNRYSTAAGSKLAHAQPILVANDAIALAHNGNLPSTAALQDFLKSRGHDVSDISDSRFVADAIAEYVKDGMTLEDAVRKTFPLITGAFCILILSKDKLIAIRDECGIRPLSLAQLNGGWIVASETCAFNPIGASFVRDVEPGEMIIIDENGLRSEQLKPGNLKLDVFEFVYFTRASSELLGRSVYEVRKKFGAQLAREKRIEADVVIPVPDTATPIALGYAREAGIPLEFGLGKNRYIQRTFIQPEQHLREQGVRMKLNPRDSVIRQKRVIVVDDSIVRGTTSQKIVRMLFETGASEVHFVVSSPPVKYPDFYGIDIAKQNELIAATKSVDEIRDFLGATSVQYLSYQGMIDAIGVPESQLNTSCFTGIYPIDIRERAKEILYK